MDGNQIKRSSCEIHLENDLDSQYSEKYIDNAIKIYFKVSILLCTTFIMQKRIWSTFFLKFTACLFMAVSCGTMTQSILTKFMWLGKNAADSLAYHT